MGCYEIGHVLQLTAVELFVSGGVSLQRIFRSVLGTGPKDIEVRRFLARGKFPHVVHEFVVKRLSLSAGDLCAVQTVDVRTNRYRSAFGKKGKHRCHFPERQVIHPRLARIAGEVETPVAPHLQ